MHIWLVFDQVTQSVGKRTLTQEMLSQISVCTEFIHQISLPIFHATAEETNEVWVTEPGETGEFSSERLRDRDVTLGQVLDGNDLATGQNASVHLTRTPTPKAYPSVSIVHGVLNFSFGEPVQSRPCRYLLQLSMPARLLLQHTVFQHKNNKQYRKGSYHHAQHQFFHWPCRLAKNSFSFGFSSIQTHYSLHLWIHLWVTKTHSINTKLILIRLSILDYNSCRL